MHVLSERRKAVVGSQVCKISCCAALRLRAWSARQHLAADTVQSPKRRRSAVSFTTAPPDAAASGPTCPTQTNRTQHSSALWVQVMLRVTDLDASIKYYTEALGMQLLRRKDNEQYKYTTAFLGYGPEEDNLVFELTHNWHAPVSTLIVGPVHHGADSLPVQGWLGLDA